MKNRRSPQPNGQTIASVSNIWNGLRERLFYTFSKQQIIVNELRQLRIYLNYASKEKVGHDCTFDIAKISGPARVIGLFRVISVVQLHHPDLRSRACQIELAAHLDSSFQNTSNFYNMLDGRRLLLTDTLSEQISGTFAFFFKVLEFSEEQRQRNQPESVHKFPPIPDAAAVHPTLTSAHQCATLVSSECSAAKLWRITQNLRPRTSRVTSASSQISCGDWLLCRTLKSRLSSTPRSGRRRGSGRPLSALPAQRIRKASLPPCQSHPHKSDASLQSARVPA